MARVKTFCCGCTLEKGTLIIAIIGNVFSAISIMMGFYDGFNWHQIVQGIIGCIANALLFYGVK
jgi:hypothetical protein